MKQHRLVAAVVFMFILAFSSQSRASQQEGRLLRFPDIYKNQVVFVYAGDLWEVSNQGGVARKLTSHPGLELFPKFSPDGNWIAFTGQYDGNMNVYVIPAEGGVPKQLTFTADVTHMPLRMGPNNQVIDWFPDGKHLLFLSRQNTFNDWFGQLYKVGLNGGLQKKLVLPKGGLTAFSPDGNKIAYNRIFRNFRTWKRYKGGMAQDIWLYDFKSNSTQQLTTYEGTDTYPMWRGNKIYFGSDRGPNQRMNLYSFDLGTKQIKQLTHFKDYDVNWPSIGGDTIIFENGGFLYTLDLNTNKVQKLTIYVPGDRVEKRPHWENVKGYIRSYSLSPKGKRALFGTRGDVFTVPAKKGNTRNLTETSGIHEKYPTWSPDGKWVAYVSDRTGEDEIYIRPQDGRGQEIRITTDGCCFRFAPVWSPDSKKLAYADKNHRLYYVNIHKKTPILVDQAIEWEIRQYSWSPDSKWLTYAKPEKNHFYSIFLYSLITKKITPVTTDFTFDSSPVFDPEGRYLFFLSRRNYNAYLGNFDGNYAYLKTAGIYLVTLQADSLSPFAPTSDEAAIQKAKKEAKQKSKKKSKSLKKKTPPLKIDLAGIQNRVVNLPIPPANIGGLRAAKGVVFYVTYPVSGLSGRMPGEKPTLHRYDLKKQKDAVLLSPISGYDLSADGSKLIVRTKSGYSIADAKAAKINPSKGKINLSKLRMIIDYPKEWEQMFNEAWRLERDYFYNPKMNGVDWKKVHDQYAVLLPYVANRFDLNYIIGEMIGELANSHTYVGGGEMPKIEHVSVGMLGADFQVDSKSGLYRIQKIYTGENWNKNVRSPLTEPGVDVKTGDYILAVNGKKLTGKKNIFSLLENTTDQSVTLLVNSRPTATGAKEVTVKPISSEYKLHQNDWVEDNRKKVEKASGGKIGYIYLTDMSAGGLNQFVKEFYPQIRKQGLIIDVRYNGGGFVDEMILERLRRVLIGMGMSRNADNGTIPERVFYGHLVCIANAYSASDGDIFPYFFKKYKLGPVIGKRTWGGVRGIRGYTPLLDGGYVTIPEFSIYGLDSKWIIENHGVEPDIEVDNRPDLVVQGKDPQLEAAINYLMKKIKEEPRVLPKRPPYLPPYPER